MWTDVVDLRDFYQTGLGEMAGRLVTRRLRASWPDLTGQSLLGIGFAAPYLRPFLGEAERCLAVMPAQQGVLRWPEGQPSLVALADESELPFPDVSIDRVILVHALESTEHVRPCLREAWRVLKESGRLMVIVPNRRGLWSWIETSPFANGHPYSARQINRLLRENLFTPLQTRGALFPPPFRSRPWLASANWVERFGERWFGHFGGALLAEATKQIYAAAPYREAKRRARGYLPVPQGFQRGGD